MECTEPIPTNKKESGLKANWTSILPGRADAIFALYEGEIT
jgi:hypothetical protein